MKKLGLIGGVGPESTIIYYKDILDGVQKRIGTSYLPPLIIESLSCFEVIRMSSEGDTAGLTDYLLSGIRNLAAAGAEIGALACNTGHLVFEQLQELSPIPLISIVEATCAEAQRCGYRKVGLLGTKATMEADFFKKPFYRNGIEVVVPDMAEQAYIADRILHELELGIIRDETVLRFKEIAERMIADEKIDAVILGCTELPIIFDKIETTVPVLDTMQLHIHALIQAILEN